MITLLALSEYNNLSMLKIRDRWSDALGIIGGVSVPPLVYIYGREALFPALIFSVFVFFLYNMTGARDLKEAAFDIAFKAFGIIYIAIPLSYLVLLRNLVSGQWWILFVLVIIWANDTAAYFTGKTMGRHSLCPSISPKKTVEGAIGGLLGGLLAAFFFNRYLMMGLGAGGVLALSIVLGIVGIIGDLSESLLKRSAGVKDSGSLIPGHGGILDRIDSLLFSIPVLYYLLVWNF